MGVILSRSTLRLPTGETVAVFYATTKDGAAGQYFNAKRLGFVGSNVSELYRRCVPKLQQTLIDDIENSELEFDAVVCPPSGTDDAQPYREAILRKWSVRDFTNTFTRNGVIKAQATETTIDDLVAREFIHAPIGCERSIKSLLIVDESIATGKSAAAMIELLRRAGMPTNAQVHIAVCSKMFDDSSP